MCLGSVVLDELDKDLDFFVRCTIPEGSCLRSSSVSLDEDDDEGLDDDDDEVLLDKSVVVVLKFFMLCKFPDGLDVEELEFLLDEAAFAAVFPLRCRTFPRVPLLERSPLELNEEFLFDKSAVLDFTVAERSLASPWYFPEVETMSLVLLDAVVALPCRSPLEFDEEFFFDESAVMGFTVAERSLAFSCPFPEVETLSLVFPDAVLALPCRPFPVLEISLLLDLLLGRSLSFTSAALFAAPSLLATSFLCVSS
jgi:hypothetical protein